MQFSCESCKATLHIGDEKVKGKRLVVRCKKCGARIQIADPALGPPPAGAAPLSSASSPPAPVSKPALAAAPAPKREETRPGTKSPKRERDASDTESTQAMDSGLLEQALLASKSDDPSALSDNLARLSGAQASRPPPPPDDAAPSPRDPPVWFAMIAGKQTGPLSRAELGLKVAQNQITARTYLWKENMPGWQRAQEVSEVSSLFGPPPSKPPPSLNNTIPPPIPSAARSGLRDLNSGDFTDLGAESTVADEPRRGRQRMEPEFSKKEGEKGEAQDKPIALGDGSKDAAASGPAQSAPAALEQPVEAKAALGLQSAPPPSGKLLASSLFGTDPGERARDPLAPAPQIDDGDRTHVEPLPLGERVHQEAVAKELFTGAESAPISGSAKDLASWASKELGRRGGAVTSAKAAAPGGPVSAKLLGASPLPESIPPTVGGAAQASRDPFANVPDAPGFTPPDPVDTTGNIIARTGVKKKQTGRLVLLFGGLIVVLALFVWSLTNDDKIPAGQPGEQAQKQSLGGTGQSVDGLVKGAGSAAPAPDAAKAQAKRAAAALPAVDKAKADEAAQNAQALAALDSERGIGDHGPKADAVATPDTSKADAALSADDIKKKLGENKGALQSCIDEALRKEPNLRVGKIHIATNISPSGVVTSAKIDKKAVDESPLGACLKRATKRIVFPAFSGDEFEVDIPILVTAGD